MTPAAAAPARTVAASGLAPLTHHAILALVEPFVRAGIAPDLAGSDRAGRRVVFRTRWLGDDALGGLPAPLATQPLAESWQLEAAEEGELVVWREVAWPDGPAARLEGRCADDPPAALADLVESMQGVGVARLFIWAEAAPTGTSGPAGVVVGALTQRLAATGREPGRHEAALVLKAAQAQVGGVTLGLSLSGVAGYPAQIELLRPPEASGGVPRRLPQDLLAVLGRAWEPLTELTRGWVGRVTVRGDEPRRSREARARFGEALAHVARTLAEPPARFHTRHRAARWAVVARDLVPWLVGLGIVAAALWARQRGGGSVLALLANVAPPLLMGLFFVRREMPRIALPRWPLRPPDDAWPASPRHDP